MIDAYIWILCIIIVVDGIKLILESFAHGEAEYFGGKSNEVTIIIAAHNEETAILNTIKSISKIVPDNNIIVVDDESSDATINTIKNGAPNVRLFPIKHKGKVGAIHSVLQYVTTPYVMLLDADIEFEEGFIIPTDALKSGKATAVSFNVVPTVQGKTFINRLLLNLQLHEYAKSMQIGKRFNNVTKSVHCISGAAGLFRIDRLIELSKEHTTIFPGEDLERTLLELDAQGQVIFSDAAVLTDVPQTFWSLTRQRIVGWWPGLWRNIWLFMRIISRRKEPARLRYELIYELVALFTDPFKIISLIGLIVTGSWKLLLFVYLVYLILEILVHWRVKILAGDYMTMKFLTMILYPIYSSIQMFYRAFAFFVFVYKKLFTKEWKKVVVTLLILLLPVLGNSQEKKNDWSVSYQYAKVEDISKDRNFDNHQLYFGWKNFYTSVSTNPYNSTNTGVYYGNFWGDIRYRWEPNDVHTKIVYENWYGAFVPRVGIGWFYRTDEKFPTGQIGMNYYFTDNMFVSFDVIKEWGRDFGSTFIGKVGFVNTTIWGTAGTSITNFGDKGAFAQLGYKWVYIHGDYYQNFDFNTFDRTSFGIGILIKF